jgi:hypothetical protein
LNRGLACLALAGLAALPRSLSSQGAPQSVPEALKESALAVRVFAVVPTPPAAGLDVPDASGTDQEAPAASPARLPDWHLESVKYTVPGSPVPFKFVGENLAVLVQVTPFARRDSQGLVLVTQGQVWVKNKEGGISYRTAIETLSVKFGEKVIFFPLGRDAGGKGPLRLEITVHHAADMPASPSAGAGQASEEKGVPGDKSGGGDKASK